MNGWHEVTIPDAWVDDGMTFRAWVDPDYQSKWNGWVCPMFTKDVADKVAAWCGRFDDALVYDAERDAYVGTYDHEAGEVFEGVDVDGMHVYPIWYGSWTWSIADEWNDARLWREIFEEQQYLHYEMTGCADMDDAETDAAMEYTTLIFEEKRGYQPTEEQELRWKKGKER